MSQGKTATHKPNGFIHKVLPGCTIIRVGKRLTPLTNLEIWNQIKVDDCWRILLIKSSCNFVASLLANLDCVEMLHLANIFVIPFYLKSHMVNISAWMSIIIFCALLENSCAYIRVWVSFPTFWPFACSLKHARVLIFFFHCRIVYNPAPFWSIHHDQQSQCFSCNSLQWLLEDRWCIVFNNGLCRMAVN